MKKYLLRLVALFYSVPLIATLAYSFEGWGVQYFRLLFDSPAYLNLFWNSVGLAVPMVAGQLAVSALAAYAFTVLRFKGKEVLFFAYIIVMLLPLQVTILPNYLVADRLGFTDSALAVILPGIFRPFGVFLLRQYMKSLPKSCMEAARLDGAGHGRIFWSIVLPMAKPALAALAMLALIDCWNLVDQALVFIQDDKRLPLSVLLSGLNGSQACAGACFYAVPVLLVLLYGQEYLTEKAAVGRARG